MSAHLDYATRKAMADDAKAGTLFLHDVIDRDGKPIPPWRELGPGAYIAPIRHHAASAKRPGAGRRRGRVRLS